MIEFLRKVLPPQGGLYIAATIVDNRTSHHIAHTLEELATVIGTLDRDPQNSVYFALSTFSQGWHATGKVNKDGKPKQQLRVVSNALQQKAFWIDVDVDPTDTKKYTSKQAAVEGIKQAVKFVGVAPLIVQTKNGYHCYWPLSEAITTAQWRPVAASFKQKLAELGIHADPTRTADAASILRPIKTTHRKTADWYSITQVRDAARDMTYAEFAGLFNAPVSTNEYPAALLALGVDPVITPIPKVEKDAIVVVNNCKQLKALLAPITYWSEPLLFNVSSILAKCFNGREVIHQMASQSPYYSGPDYTDEKFDVAIEADHAPALCTTIEGYNPTGCAGCPFKGVASTPLHTKVIPIPADAAVPDFVKAALHSKTMKEYEVVFEGERTGVYAQVTTETQDALGDVVTKTYQERILHVALVPLYTILLEDDTVELYWRMYHPDGASTDVVTTANQLSRIDALAVWLINNRIIYNRRLVANVADYMHSFWGSTVGEQPALPRYTQLGWVTTTNAKGTATEDGFVLGETVLWPHKAPMRAVLAPSIQTLGPKYAAKGSRDAWFKMIELYKTPEYAWAQAIICLGFGSILAPWLGNNDGQPLVYLYGKHSGIGKSAVAQIAVSIYGSPKSQQTAPGTSAVARITNIASLCHIPTLHDELTHSHQPIIEAFLMALSQNKDKQRLAPTGAHSQVSEKEWSSVAIATGNTAFAQNIANSSTVDIPVLSRLVHIDLDHMCSRGTPDQDIVSIVNLRNTNYGIIGREWIQYLLDNMANVVERSVEIRREVARDFKEVQQERIQGNAYALVKLGAELGKAAGLHNFEWQDIAVECQRWVDTMRVYTGTALAKSHDWFNDLLRYLAQKTLVVATDDRPPKEFPNQHIIKRPAQEHAPAARLVRDTKYLYVPTSVVHKFTEVEKLSFASVKSAWIEQGLLVDAGTLSAAPYSITKHTEYAGQRGRCFIFSIPGEYDYIEKECTNNAETDF